MKAVSETAIAGAPLIRCRRERQSANADRQDDAESELHVPVLGRSGKPQIGEAVHGLAGEETAEHACAQCVPETARVSEPTSG